MNPKDLISLLDRPIAYHRIFAQITGSVTTGVFLSQAVYWSLRTKDPDGWFWKIREEWFEETYIKRAEQETARKRLVKLGILEEKRAGIPAKMYFRINHEKLSELMFRPDGNEAANKTVVGSQQCSNEATNSGLTESQPDGGDDANQLAANQPTINTEITQVISSESFKDPLYPPKGDLGDANASQEEEVSEAEVTSAQEESDPVQPKPKLEGQSSAPRRSASKAINAVRRQYADLPEWRTGWEVGAYHESFKDFVQREVIKKLPANTVWATYTPVDLIEENEAKGKFASLEDRCKQWQAAETKRLAAEQAQATAIAQSPQPPQPEYTGPQATMEAIAKLMQELGESPPAVLEAMLKKHPIIFNKLPKDTLRAWQSLGPAHRPLIFSYLLSRKEATLATR